MTKSEKAEHLRRERLYQISLKEKAEAAIRDLENQIEEEELRAMEALFKIVPKTEEV